MHKAAILFLRKLSMAGDLVTWIMCIGHAPDCLASLHYPLLVCDSIASRCLTFLSLHSAFLCHCCLLGDKRENSPFLLLCRVISTERTFGPPSPKAVPKRSKKQSQSSPPALLLSRSLYNEKMLFMAP